MAESTPAAKRHKQNTLGGYFSRGITQSDESDYDTDHEQESESDTEKDGDHSQPGKLAGMYKLI